MLIVTEGHKWVVKAEWYGEIRTVFSSMNIFECIRFKVTNS